MKNRKQTKQVNRFHPKIHKNGQRYAYQTPSANICINIKTEKHRKSLEKIMTEREKSKRMKKVKFITQDIEKSIHFSNNRTKSCFKEQSGMFLKHNVEEENVYDVPSTMKKIEKGEQRFGGQHIDIGRIKTRKGKTHSKEPLALLKSPFHKNTQKQNKKHKDTQKHTLKTYKSPQSRQFLSPQIVRQQNSYFFSEPAGTPPAQTLLVIPKKESRFIFESSRSFWNQLPIKASKSFLDLLN